LKLALERDQDAIFILFLFVPILDVFPNGLIYDILSQHTEKEDKEMGNRATYTAEYLGDGHLSIPQEIANKFSLKSGNKIRVMIETSKFNKADFLKLFGIWKQKNAGEIAIFKSILEERKRFGRGEVKL